MEYAENNFVRKEQCPQCNGADKLARYDDGHAHCFKAGCGYREKSNGDKMSNVVSKINRAPELPGIILPISERRISQQTAKKYGVHSEYAQGTHDVIRHHYPYFDAKGSLQGTKIRILSDKDFRASGDMRNNALFGQHLFKSEGKFVTLVEGELDALAAYEMLGSRWPVVSISKGAGGAKGDVQKNLEWLEGFENVVIMFDNDDAGKIAAEEVAQVLSPNKAKIVTLGDYKDASDYLTNNKIKDFTSEWWNAKTYVMAGIITLADAWDDFVRRGTEKVMPFPDSFGEVNKLLKGGIVAGEVTVVGALTSVGKTTMVNEIIYNFWKNTDKHIGCAFLEADKGEVLESLMAIDIDTNISDMDDRSMLDFEALRDREILNSGRILMVDHLGSLPTDELFIKLRAMVKGNGVEILVIDPLQQAVPTNSNEAIDDFMDRLLKLAKETGASIVLISHMRKPAGNDAHHVSEYDMKGSGSINQVSFNTILLSRDKMADDEYERNSTKIQVVKCRRTGKTGFAGWIHYVNETGRLEKGEAPEVYDANKEDEF